MTMKTWGYYDGDWKFEVLTVVTVLWSDSLGSNYKAMRPIGSQSSCLWTLPSPIHSLIAPILQLPSLYQWPFFYPMELVPWKWKQQVPLKQWYLSTTTSNPTRQQSSVTILEIYLIYRVSQELRSLLWDLTVKLERKEKHCAFIELCC
jgi:hypothetical protein